MGLNIPSEAMPVVEVLRRDVEKPKAEGLVMNCLGPELYAPRWQEGPDKRHFCPMGLHEDSVSRLPDTKADFADGEQCNLLEITGFSTWWDNLALEDAKQAVDLIWPEGK